MDINNYLASAKVAKRLELWWHIYRAKELLRELSRISKDEPEIRRLAARPPRRIKIRVRDANSCVVWPRVVGFPHAPHYPPNVVNAMAVYPGRVKAVLSGDTVVLESISAPGKERLLNLAYVTAPHLRKDAEEPFAFASREFLRKAIVGRGVNFSVVYEVPTTKRQYGTIILPEGQRFPETAVEQGWVKLRDDAKSKDEPDSLDELKLLEAQARSAERGIWATSGGKVDIRNNIDDPQAFIGEWKGKTVDAIVERVLSGDRLLIRLLLMPTQHVSTMVLVAGIRAPITERTNPSNGQVQPAEEYGNEAKKFVEDRLLQRSVRVHILGLSPQNIVVGSVLHPKGNIATFILEAGLARCNDFQSTMLGPEMANLRQAERKAQAAKLCLHKDHVAKVNSGSGPLDATVARVWSADVITVRNKAGAEKRINITSIRGPRQAEASEAPWREEAKEFVRKKLIGKHVRVSIDGVRPATGEYEARESATVTHNEKNIGLLLVQEGLCTVIRHKRDDPDRAPNYDDLLAAQEKAKEEGKGIWSGKKPTVKTYVDASESVQKAKMQLASLQRQKKVPAIVDFVKAGSRFSVLIPREGIKLNFVLGGIRAPKVARGPTDKSEPFGQEAYDLAQKRCSQRDVEIDVHAIDKVGGFIGELYINRESFAKILVEEGLASVHAYSAEQSGNANELFAAEQRAKEARKNLWQDWDPSQDVVEEEADDHQNGTNGDTPVERKQDYRDVVVTNIDESGKLKIQLIGTGTSALEQLMSAFKSFHINPANSAGLPNDPKAGDFVAAKFSEDGQWYRARVRSNDRAAKKAEVVYIDYGNSEKISWSQLRPLTQPQFTVQKLKAQAVDAVLSLIQLPTNEQYLKDAIDYMTQLTAGKELVANVDFTGSDGCLYITLYDQKTSQSSSDSINGDIVAEGLAMVPRKLKSWERSFADVLKTLKEREEEAKTDRRGIWEYGDLTED